MMEVTAYNPYRDGLHVTPYADGTALQLNDFQRIWLGTLEDNAGRLFSAAELYEQTERLGAPGVNSLARLGRRLQRSSLEDRIVITGSDCWSRRYGYDGDPTPTAADMPPLLSPEDGFSVPTAQRYDVPLTLTQQIILSRMQHAEGYVVPLRWLVQEVPVAEPNAYLNFDRLCKKLEASSLAGRVLVNGDAKGHLVTYLPAKTTTRQPAGR